MSLQRSVTTRIGSLCFAFVVISSSAHAISVSLDSTSLNSKTTTTGQAGSTQGATNLSVVSAGGSAPDVLSAGASFEMKYTSVAVADNGQASPGDSITINHNYSATVTLSAGPNVTYAAFFESFLAGGLTVVDDQATGNGPQGVASVSKMTAFIDGVEHSGLGIDNPGSVSGGSTPTDNGSIGGFGSYILNGLQGSHTIQFQFTWATSALSGQSVGASDGDEAAARYGMAGTLLDVTADDYPGLGNRDITADGHRFQGSVWITSVPEPSTIALAAFGLLALVGVAVRRRS